MIKNRKILAIITTLAVLGSTISLFAHFESRFPGDLRVTLLFQSIHSQSLLIAMKGVSYIAGDWGAVIVVVISFFPVLFLIGRWEAGLLALTGITNFLNDAFKLAVNRPRPTPDQVSVFVTESGKSFPSGHAFFAVLVFGILTYLIMSRQSERIVKMMVLSFFVILILGVGASRIYLGVHWMSDVIGGYIVGSLFLAVLIWLYRTFRPRFDAKVYQGKK